MRRDQAPKMDDNNDGEVERDDEAEPASVRLGRFIIGLRDALELPSEVQTVEYALGYALGKALKNERLREFVASNVKVKATHIASGLRRGGDEEDLA